MRLRVAARNDVYTILMLPLQGGLSSLSLRERVRVRGLYENKTNNKFSIVEFIFSTRFRPARAMGSK